MELEQIAKAYAKNRESLRTVNKQISLLIDSVQIGGKDYVGIDLAACREWVYACNHFWNGWVDAVTQYDGDELDIESPEYKLAGLLDRKVKIRQEAGQIKRNLYHAGNKLLKEK